MHELSRLAYLNSLGIDAYISRGQQPGAAPSRRLMVVPPPAGALAATAPSTAASNMPAPAVRPSLDLSPSSRPVVPRGLDRASHGETPGARGSSTNTRPAAAEKAHVTFSLAALVAGRILWLESLGEMPLASEQVSLVQAMAHALERCVAASQAGAAQRPEIARFDWPMHQNQQLDNSREAALAGLTAFMQRRIEQHQCRAVVMLGSATAQWVAGAALDVPVVQSLSTRQMIEDAASKAQVWRELSPLRVSD